MAGREDQILPAEDPRKIVLRTLLVLLLSGCAGGFSYDPSGGRWPSDVVDSRTKTVIVNEVDSPSDLDPKHRDLLGFSLPGNKVCRVVIPKVVPPDAARCGWTKNMILAHEVGHCEGTTVHRARPGTCPRARRGPERPIKAAGGASAPTQRVVRPDEALFKQED